MYFYTFTLIYQSFYYFTQYIIINASYNFYALIAAHHTLFSLRYTNSGNGFFQHLYPVLRSVHSEKHQFHVIKQRIMLAEAERESVNRSYQIFVMPLRTCLSGRTVMIVCAIVFAVAIAVCFMVSNT